MTYDPNHQFRATIIRGKAKRELDNMLSAYANIISDICPTDSETFNKEFNARLLEIIPGSDIDTLNNHRTEIAGKLFGMYFRSADEQVFCSERTLQLLENWDQPFFFKDICFKFQFPNGMDKQNLLGKLENKLSIRQFPFILKVLVLARELETNLTKDEVGYYVLNSLDVLQGIAHPNEVLDAILADRKSKKWSGERRYVYTEGKAASYDMQHINEQIGLLELANLVRTSGDVIYLNRREDLAIEYFASKWDSKPEFNVYAYDLYSSDGRRQFYLDWDYYYSQLSAESATKFVTELSALIPEDNMNEEASEEKEVETKGGDTKELGDSGELYVFDREKQRVSDFDGRLANRVKLLAKTKGLGYDVLSVVAKAGDDADFATYIEVKATKRVTAPDPNSLTWIDTVNLTRNEWIAARQHQNYFFIFRVYFTASGVEVFVINNPAEKCEKGLMKAVATNYRLDFRSDVVQVY